MFDLLGGQSIHICGMTKSLCPGLRIAYMAFSEQYKTAILHGLMNVNIKTSSLDAEIITELILSGDAYKIAEQKYSAAKKNCLLYEKYFPAQEPTQVPICYYRWLPISAKKSFMEIEQELADLGVRVYHSDRFAVADKPDEAYLRISLCSAGNRTRLEQGFKILQNYIGKSELSPQHKII